MTLTRAPRSNGSRFAARPLTVHGTSTQDWLGALARVPELDLTGCTEMIVVAPHPDDESLGFGASAATLAGLSVHVQVVSVSDGGASAPGVSSLHRYHLERTRRAELHRATAVLGIPGPICLGLPDGDLSGHEERLTDLLTEILAARPSGTWCAATWRGDGHPDHEAVGRAAAVATRRSGVVLLEYPVWMWHWATPGDNAVPWDRVRAMPLAANAVERKAGAAQCYRTQLEASDPGAAPIVPPFVLRRLLSVREVVIC